VAPAQANDPVAGVQYPHHGFVRKVHLRAQVRTPGCALARACVSTGVLCWEVGQRLPRTALRTTLACTQAYRDTAREAQSAQNGHHWDANRAHAQHQAVPQVDSNTVQAPVHAHCAQQHVAAGTRNEDLRPCPGSQSERARGKDGSCAPGSCEHATYAHAQAGQGQTDRAHCEAQEEARHPEDEAETEDQSTELEEPREELVNAVKQLLDHHKFERARQGARHGAATRHPGSDPPRQGRARTGGIGRGAGSRRTALRRSSRRGRWPRRPASWRRRSAPSSAGRRGW